MKKVVGRLIGGVTALVVFAIIAAVLAMRASLPQLDGEIRVRDLTDRVTLARDADGVPVISAKNRSDLAFATGFAHGQDRSFQMDLIRRQAAGELSEIVGRVAINVDRRNRFHRFRQRAADIVATLPRAERELLVRYADGVNAGRSSLRARQFEYFVLGVTPEPWLPEDSILTVFAMYLQLNDARADKDVRRGLSHRVLPPEVYAWMYPDGSPWDAPLMGEPRVDQPIPDASILSLRGISEFDGDANEQDRLRLPGSNNWAVSGAHTKSGRAMVSNDMHLGLNVPNIYYRARLVMDGDTPLDISGVSLPGVPFIVAGSNGQVAWGFTNSYGDYSDPVLLHDGATPGTYSTPQGDRTFAVVNEKIEVKGEAAVDFAIRETIWGPVRDDIDYPHGEIAVSWIAHSPAAVNLKMLQLESVGSVQEALNVANTLAMPPQNFVAGDSQGNIGWTIAGKIPAKSDFDSRVPADWSTRDGWTGWIQPDDYPRVLNPDSGRIWTANSRVSDADALRVIGDGGYDLGARAGQIRDRLFAKEIFSAEDMLAIQHDDEALFLARWRNLLLEILDAAAVSGDEQLREYRQLVERWIPRASVDSVGYRLVRAFRLDVRQRVFHALTASVRDVYGDDARLRISNQFEAPLWSLLTQRPLHMLPGNYDNWPEFLRVSVRRNIDYFEQNFAGGLQERTWGEANTATIRHPLARSIPFLGEFLNMPAQPLSGDANMPKAQGPAFGASQRFSVMPGGEEDSLMQMPTGASGHPMSGFYRAGHASWVDGTASPYLPGATVHTLTLVPDRG